METAFSSNGRLRRIVLAPFQGAIAFHTEGVAPLNPRLISVTPVGVKPGPQQC